MFSYRTLALRDTGRRVSERTVRDASFDVLRDRGLTTIFGNPGSTEVPFLAGFPGRPPIRAGAARSVGGRARHGLGARARRARPRASPHDGRPRKRSRRARNGSGQPSSAGRSRRAAGPATSGTRALSRGAARAPGRRLPCPRRPAAPCSGRSRGDRPGLARSSDQPGAGAGHRPDGRLARARRRRRARFAETDASPHAPPTTRRSPS